MAPRLILRKRLSNTDVRHRLAFPTAVLDLLPTFEGGANRNIDLSVRVRHGDEFKLHVLRCVIRRMGYRKPVLERGWKQLVREKGLRQADWLLLYIDDDAGGFVFEFQRSIRLLGLDIYCMI